MDIHMIDEFRRRTNASYDEASYYLEKHNGDLLEAIIAFEREKTGFQGQGTAHSRTGGFVNGLIKGIQMLFDTKLIITDKNLKTFNIPIILPLILIPAWHVFIIMAIVMYFMGFRFTFHKIPDANVNVESIVNKIKDKVNENRRSC